jgi:WD40 repeat protein
VVAKLNLPLGANDSMSSGALKFSPDGNFLASCHGRGEDQTVVVVWEIHTWAIAHRIKDILPGSGCSAVEFTADGKYLVRLLSRSQKFEGPTLVIYRTNDWHEVAALRTNPFFGEVLAIHPDGKFLAIGGTDYPLGAKDDATAANPFLQFGDHASRIVILDLQSLKIIKSFTTNSKIGLWSTLAWSPDGSTILHAAGHGLQAISVDNEKEAFSTKASTGLAPGAAIYTANGLYLIEAQGRKSNILRIWDQAHRQLYQSFDGEFDAVAASADGKILAATTTGKTLIFRLSPKKP